MSEQWIGWMIAFITPIIVLQLQNMASSRQQASDLALKQARRDEAIDQTLQQIRSTLDEHSKVLDNIQQRLTVVELKQNSK